MDKLTGEVMAINKGVKGKSQIKRASVQSKSKGIKQNNMHGRFSFRLNEKHGKSRILIFAILSIILASGCIGQSSTPLGSDGLVIENMFIDPPETDIQSGELITIRADVQNVGSATARGVVAELIGASWLPGGSDAITTQILGDMSPPDPRFGLPGHVRQIGFRIPAPLLPEGQKANFDLKIRVNYDYETTSIAQVQGYGRERYNTLFQQGKVTPPVPSSLPVQVSRNVPVTINVIGPDKVVVGPSQYEEYTYQITFSNVGSQLPITPRADGTVEDGLIWGTLWVLGPGVFFSNCLDVGPGILVNSLQSVNPTVYDQTFNSASFSYQEKFGDKFSAWYQDLGWDQAYGLAAQIGSLRIGVANIPDPQLANPGYILFPNALDWQLLPVQLRPIKLRKGESVTKSCTIGIVNTPGIGGTWAGRPESSFILNAYLRYRYFIDQPLRISVSAPLARSLPSGAPSFP
ncbi:MAG: hypothetical protein HYW25_03060 [Candidatus Aenigmarchaeota archaeon]|nr:hypothetical protein [Candidatus Aenigmarchaeota archaeon]